MTPADNRIPVSALLSSLPLEFAPAVAALPGLGYEWVDVRGMANRPAEHLEALADSGLRVACVAIGQGLHDELTLDSPSLARRRETLDLARQHVADAARLGAHACYLIPGLEPGRQALECFTEAVHLLASEAKARFMRLCVEPVPGRALPAAADVLWWLDRQAADNLFLLLDIGHCQISGEDPCAVLRAAGPRLGYVHLDDNDGAGDLHWPLLTGRLSRNQLGRFLAALRETGYRAGVALEYRPGPGHDSFEALRQGRLLAEQLLAERPAEPGGPS